MGQVFTWDAVRQGHVPAPANFKTVADMMRKIFGREKTIVSALLFGSVVRGDLTIRSDIDCAVLYDPAHEVRVVQILQEVTAMARGFHVPINFALVDSLIAWTRFHNFGPSFRRHLSSAVDYGGVIKGDFPLTFADSEPERLEIESYLRQKLYKIQCGLAELPSFSPVEQADFLKKAMEAVMHIARKTLIYREGKIAGDSKAQVQEKYMAVMPPPIGQLFDELIRIDLRYTARLVNSVANPCEASYAEALAELVAAIPLVARFLRESARYMQKIRP